MLRNDTDLLPGVPNVESPFFADHFDADRTDPWTWRVACDLRRDGYAIIDFPDAQIAERADRIVATLEPDYPWDAWRQGAVAGLRLQDAWEYNDDVRAVAVNARLIALLSDLYGRQAVPFQTLNFPVGTQQHFHTDSVHFSSIPERFMCGVWLALEDIHIDAGPLVYYPGSHSWPIYVNEHIGHAYDPEGDTQQSVYEPLWRRLVEVHGIAPERLTVKKGQALIWAANLLHGGDEHRDRARTRWSQVTHYYFEGCSYYTPMGSDPAAGSIMFREPRNMLTGERMENRYAGEPVDPAFVRYVDPRAKARLPDDFDADAYLAANPDVIEGGMEAGDHYLRYGRREGRPLRP